MTLLYNQKIAILNSDPITSQVIQQAFSTDSVECHEFATLLALLDSLRTRRYDFYIMAWTVTDGQAITAISLLRQMHADNSPIIVFHDNDEQIITQALNVGADAFIAKPLRSKELVARVRAVLRRSRNLFSQDIGAIKLAHLEIDVTKNISYVDGLPVKLTNKELNLSHYLCERPNVTVSREELLNAVWQQKQTTQSRTIDAHINQIRRKLRLNYDPNSELYIQNIRGEGYQLVYTKIND